LLAWEIDMHVAGETLGKISVSDWETAAIGTLICHDKLSGSFARPTGS
jgi:hypothetical protein